MKMRREHTKPLPPKAVEILQELHKLTIVSYAGSTNPQWAAEADAFIAWRDAALVHMFQQLDAVEAKPLRNSNAQGPAPVRPSAGPQPDAEQQVQKKRARPFFPFEPSTVSWRREHRR
ncbi:Hypothetical protein NGAL_HAMBI1189_31730 [Neorhizobium galegae bv. officinalis]|uniref:Uncharacterized protein n=2 Tax=Neorhizobium galegae TaxID=399 RepID=A0A0T7GRE1_NEOGA|nr:Hypothetical protein NGAL_HAMBI1189_31730 [Neorhizobium galegae bv. officinalis]